MILLSCIFRHRIKKEVELILGSVFTRLFSTLKEIVTKNVLSFSKLQRFIITYHLWIAAYLRYQPPLPAEQVKAFTEFDYDGGSFTL